MRKPSRSDDVAQHVSRLHGRELVRIPDKDDLHPGRNPFEERPCEKHVKHRCLIDDEHLSVKLVDAEPLSVVSEHAVYRHSLQPLYSDRFGHSLCGLSCRGGKEDVLLLDPVPHQAFDHSPEGGRLSCSGASRKDEETALSGLSYRLPLEGVVPVWGMALIRELLLRHLDVRIGHRHAVPLS